MTYTVLLCAGMRNRRITIRGISDADGHLLKITVKGMEDDLLSKYEYG